MSGGWQACLRFDVGIFREIVVLIGFTDRYRIRKRRYCTDNVRCQRRTVQLYVAG